MSAGSPGKGRGAPTGQMPVRKSVVLLAIAPAALVVGLLLLGAFLLWPEKRHEPHAVAIAPQPEPTAPAPPVGLPAQVTPPPSQGTPQVPLAASAFAAMAPGPVASAHAEAPDGSASSRSFNPGLSQADFDREADARERLLEREVDLAKQGGDQDAIDKATARLQRFRSRRADLEKPPSRADSGP